MNRLHRRSLLLGALGLPALAYAQAPLAQRSWSGRGSITVIASSEGDPRSSPTASTDSTYELALAMAPSRGSVVSATGIAGGGVAMRVAETSGLTAVDGGAEEADAVRMVSKVAFGLFAPGNEAFRARRASLARPGRDLGGYAQLRADGLVRIQAARDALEAAMQARLHALPRRSMIIVPALMAAAWCAALEADGRGGSLCVPAELSDRIDDAPLWWAGMVGGLPASTGWGLEPWTASLKPYVAALKAWPGLDAVQKAIEEKAGSGAVLLDPTGIHANQVRAASTYLVDHRLPGDVTIALAEGAGQGLAMSYNSWTNRLHLAPSSANWPTPLMAAVLFHELVHVRDVGRFCSELDCSPRMFATMLDTLPLGVGIGILCSMEDRAYAEEVAVLETLGIPLPDPTVPFGPDPVSRLLQLLAMLKGAPLGSPQWMTLVDTMVMQRFHR